MKRALFICTQNRLRSPTAEKVFNEWNGVEAKSAGLGADATVSLDAKLLEWATLIFVMEKSHLNKLSKKFKMQIKDKRVICLEIPDEYEFMQPELIRLLEGKAGRYFFQG